MILIDKALQERERAGRPIQVGIAGAGEMGKGMINQITRHTPGMRVAAVHSRTPEKAAHGFSVAGIEEVVVTDSVRVAEEAVANGTAVITRDIDLLFELHLLDVLVEATGTIDFGARASIKAFDAGVNVLSFNAELDSTFGPILKEKAGKAGVKYAQGDGDQPGVTMNLYRYARGLGFEPVVCGNIKGMLDHYRTPETQKAFAERWGMNPWMAANFADGTKIAFEQSCIANATGMKVAKRGMLGYESTKHVDELTGFYDLEELQALGGIVDYIVGAKPSPGVFVYATTSDPLSKKYMHYSKMGEGPLYSFYLPYHLLFLDIASSICRLIDFDDPVIVAADGPVVEVVATAKTDLKPGDMLDGFGGFKTYGLCENYSMTQSENLLPMGLANGCRVIREVEKNEVLTWEDVEIGSWRFIDRLMQEQNLRFGGEKDLPYAHAV